MLFRSATNRWLIDNVESFGGWEEEDVKAFAVSLFATKNVVSRGKT